MKQINNRSDISTLVHLFYSKIRKDELLGPIFNKHLTEKQWSEHLEKLTAFWETNLFGVANFKGNPSLKHIDVDKAENYRIEQRHFEAWLHLWFETIDQLFEGDLALKAKQSAQKMGTGQYLVIWNNKPAHCKKTSK